LLVVDLSGTEIGLYLDPGHAEARPELRTVDGASTIERDGILRVGRAAGQSRSSDRRQRTYSVSRVYDYGCSFNTSSPARTVIRGGLFFGKEETGGPAGEVFEVHTATSGAAPEGVFW